MTEVSVTIRRITTLHSPALVGYDVGLDEAVKYDMGK